MTIIKDSMPPLIALNGDAMISIPLNQTFVDPGVNAVDTVRVVLLIYEHRYTYIHWETDHVR